MRDLFELENIEITPVELSGNGLSGNGIEYTKEEDLSLILINLSL